MGIRDKNGNLRGKIGNLTYRMRGDQNIVQTCPGKGQTRMSEASLVGSREFALGSNRAKVLRTVMQPLIRGMYDGKMINRFTTVVLQTIRSNREASAGARDLQDGEISKLEGFEFNQHSPAAFYFKEKINLSLLTDGVHLQIPAFAPGAQLSFPLVAESCKLTVLLSALDLKNSRYTHCELKSLDIAQGTTYVAETNWLFNKNLTPDVLFTMGMSLEYFANGLLEKLSLNTIQLNPVMLLGVFRLPQLTAPQLFPEESNIWGNWFPIPGLDASQ